MIILAKLLITIIALMFCTGVALATFSTISNNYSEKFGQLMSALILPAPVVAAFSLFGWCIWRLWTAW